jgi:hypothetical protein
MNMMHSVGLVVTQCDLLCERKIAHMHAGSPIGGQSGYFSTAREGLCSSTWSHANICKPDVSFHVIYKHVLDQIFCWPMGFDDRHTPVQSVTLVIWMAL